MARWPATREELDPRTEGSTLTRRTGCDLIFPSVKGSSRLADQLGIRAWGAAEGTGKQVPLAGDGMV